MIAAPEQLSHRYGCVIFLDLLGTKRIIQDEEIRNFVRRYSKFLSDEEELIKMLNDYLRQTISHPVKPEIKIHAFSDTVIMTFSIDNEQKAQIPDDPILSRSALTLPYFIVYSFLQGLYFRGCISIGEFYEADRMLLGAAIYEAAEYYDKPQWVGISAAPSVKGVLTINEISRTGNANDYFVKWKLPLKEERIENDAWAISWPMLKHYEIVPDFKEQAMKAFKKIKTKISEELKSPDSSIRMKWENTSNFLNFMQLD